MKEINRDLTKVRTISPTEREPLLDYVDPVIEAYEKDVDRSIIRENLKLTVHQRFEKFEQFMKYVGGLSKARRTSQFKG